MAPCSFSSPPAAYPNFRHSLYIGSYLLSISFTKSWIQAWGCQLSWESDCCHRLGDLSFILGAHVSGSCEFIISSSGADRDRGILRAWWPASRAYVVTSRFTPLKGCGAISWLGQAHCTQELTAATVTCTGPVQEQPTRSASTQQTALKECSGLQDGGFDVESGACSRVT